MANQNNINGLNNIYNNFVNFNKAEFYRYDLGQNSLENEVEPIVKKIIEKLSIVKNYGSELDDYLVNIIISETNQIYMHLHEYSKLQTSQMTIEKINQHKNQYYIWIRDKHNKLLTEKWPIIITSIIEEKGLLNLDVNNKVKQIEESINDIFNVKKTEYEKNLKTAKESFDNSLKLIKEKENNVKEKLVKSAKKISVEDVQKQFDDARIRNRNQCMIWGSLSFFCIVAFILIARYFYFDVPNNEYLKQQIDLFKENFIEINRWNSIYHTVIRVMILAGVGAIATFSLKIFRANLHMYQQNMHRKRISNSIAAFVEAAYSETQSDKILELLIESVASFGHSGLIQKEDDHIYPSKMVVDNVTRSLISGK